VNRILPLFLVIAAIGLHFLYCEWHYFRDSTEASTEQNLQAIYYYYSGPPNRHSLFLLPRPSETREDAQLFGVVLPGVLVGAAIVVAHFRQKAGGGRSPA
jgi:hypothetical protein